MLVRQRDSTGTGPAVTIVLPGSYPHYAELQ